MERKDKGVESLSGETAGAHQPKDDFSPLQTIVHSVKTCVFPPIQR
jgi:hypothetical protein